MAVSGCFYGAPGEIRTPDLVVRSHALYPTELRARIDSSGENKFSMCPHTLYDCTNLTSLSNSNSLMDGGEGGIRTHDGAINPILP